MFYIPHFEQTTTWVRLNKLGPITQRAVCFWTAFRNLVSRVY